ncbi:MAG: diguanylate cyclase [Actinomycetota bacterium]
MSSRLQLDGADLLFLLPEPTAVLDDRGRIAVANPALTRLLGRDDLVGRSLVDLTDDPEPSVVEQVRRWAASSQLSVGFLAFETPDGTVVHRCGGVALGRGGNVVLRIEQRIDSELELDTAAPAVLLAELETRRAAEARLTRLAFQDPVTGLLNRTGFDDRLRALLEVGGPLSLIYVDLDRFKAINDVFGHEAGDEALREAARRLASAVRPQDLLARLGGDEFVATLAGVEAEQALAVGERLAHALGQGFRLGEEHVELGGSLGVAVRRPGEGAGDLLRRADAAMYRAKRQGGHRVELAAQGDTHSRLSA